MPRTLPNDRDVNTGLGLAKVVGYQCRYRMAGIAPNESKRGFLDQAAILVREFAPPPHVLLDLRRFQSHGIAQDMMLRILEIAAERLRSQTREVVNPCQRLIRCVR